MTAFSCKKNLGKRTLVSLVLLIFFGIMINLIIVEFFIPDMIIEHEGIQYDCWYKEGLKSRAWPVPYASASLIDIPEKHVCRSGNSLIKLNVGTLDLEYFSESYEKEFNQSYNIIRDCRRAYRNSLGLGCDWL